MSEPECKKCTCDRPEIKFWSERFSDMFNEKIICTDAECPIHGGVDTKNDDLDDQGEKQC